MLYSTDIVVKTDEETRGIFLRLEREGYQHIRNSVSNEEISKTKQLLKTAM
jgi:hypothetical protein